VSNISILIADNHQDFLDTCAELLETAGYQVYKAINPIEAREIMETAHLHLAVLDLRLNDDDDPNDKSGLKLAQNVARTLPKLILTRFPSVEDVVASLKSDLENLPPAVDFVDKRLGFETLAPSVKQVLDAHVRINWDLIINWESFLSFSQLAQLIDASLTKSLLVSRASELEDLFRTLFYDYSQITVGELLIDAAEHVILKVFGHGATSSVTPFIVSCGQQARIRDKAERYQAAVSQHANIINLQQSISSETVHFGATAYRFSGDLDETVSLADYWRNPTRNLEEVIDNLFTKNLKNWYGSGRFINPEKTLVAFYHQWLQRSGFNLDPNALQERIEALCKHILATNLGQINYQRHALSIKSENNQHLTVPNPAQYLDGSSFVREQEVQWGLTHGQVNTKTVLVGKKGRTCLIDFSRAEMAPLLHDFVSLEVSIKLGLLQLPNLTAYPGIERDLLKPTRLDEEIGSEEMNFNAGDILPIIGRIRQQAAELAGCDYTAYLKGLFFHYIAHIHHYRPAMYYTRRQLTPYAYALLSAAMISQVLLGANPETLNLPQQAQSSLWVDKVNQVVWVEGNQVEITSQDFRILLFLYERANQLCTRQEIVEEGLNEVYDSYDPEQSRLNSAISRLRQKIEPDQKNLKYLKTMRGRGYRLELKTNASTAGDPHFRLP